MTTHIMCDIETLGTRPGAIVLSVAFVRFSDEAHITVNLSVADQEMLGLERDPQTVAWWAQQDQQAYARATSDAQPLAIALPYISQWIAWASGGDFQLWCHGATFDAPLLGEVFRRANIECPWGGRNYWRVRDTRTLYDLALIDVRNYAVPPPHVALNDAIGQTRAANAALAILARAHQVAA
jgi:3' exoribonuclease, RNase T-like